MKAKIVICNLLLLNLAGCTDQTSHRTVSNLANTTGHSIEIEFYKNGVANPMIRKTIRPKEIKDVFVDQEEGLGIGFIFPTSISGFEFDSLIVEFDSKKKRTHYGANVKGNNTYAVEFINSRNLFNETNWEKEILKNTRKRFEAEYTYTFTEQDYLSAK